MTLAEQLLHEANNPKRTRHTLTLHFSHEYQRDKAKELFETLDKSCMGGAGTDLIVRNGEGDIATLYLDGDGGVRFAEELTTGSEETTKAKPRVDYWD